MNWRGSPLTSHETIVNTIATTTTRTGLRMHAELDTAPDSTGRPASRRCVLVSAVRSAKRWFLAQAPTGFQSQTAVAGGNRCPRTASQARAAERHSSNATSWCDHTMPSPPS
ncbi:hypothetical protein GCM10009647_066890 [Streptomyces sanglieri]